MDQAIVRFRPCCTFTTPLLFYALVNPKTLDSVISEIKGVAGQTNISVTQSRDLVIPLPSANEQSEIVGILYALLARAFRGELGINDPNEQSATELLKVVLR